MVESEIQTEEVLAAPEALPPEIGSGKIRNTALHRIHEALTAVMVGGILGFLAIGLPAGVLLSIVRPGLGIYHLIPIVAGAVIGAGLALRAELMHQRQSPEQYSNP